jgi:signal transduction histidine kinase
MSKDQRKIANFLRTGLSKGYYLHILSGGIAFLGILMLYAVRLLGQMNTVIETIPDPVLSNNLVEHINTIAILFLISFLCFLGGTVFYMIVLGQRVAGPVIAICSYIEELKAGNYSAKRSLRKNDELVPIMQELRELAEILEKKK